MRWPGEPSPYYFIRDLEDFVQRRGRSLLFPRGLFHLVTRAAAPTTLPFFFHRISPAKIMILPLLEAWIPKNCPADANSSQILGRNIESP